MIRVGKWTMLLVCCLTLSQSGCRTVSRISPNKITDLSGEWNDSDARLTSETLVGQCLSENWLTEFITEHGHKPIIRVRGIVNATDEHIDALTFIKSIERVLINSGKVKVLAQAGAELSVIEQEQQDAVSGRQDKSTPVRVGKQKGADLVVSVRIATILDQITSKRTKFYQVDFELIDSSTGEKVFVGEHKIKKYITQPGARW